MRALIAALALVVPALAFGHEIGVSRSEWAVVPGEARVVSAELAFARGEVLGLAPKADADGDGLLTEAELPAARPAVETLAGGLKVSQGDATCAVTIASLALTEADGLAAHLRATCPADVQTVEIRADFVEGLAPGHRHLAVQPGAPGPLVLHRGSRSATLSLASTAAPAPFDAAGMVTLGVEHIVTGYDHLVFLLGLLLIGGRLRTLLGIVTAFTVAHSLTLGLAATGVLTPPPALVEAAIAGSILYVGLENLIVREPRHRWRLTFAFGLVHGFGFAGVLAEIGLKDHLVPTLLTFNLGVEMGQLAILAVALPLLLLARRLEGFRVHGVRFASAGVAIAGAVWLVQRV